MKLLIVSKQIIVRRVLVFYSLVEKKYLMRKKLFSLKINIIFSQDNYFFLVKVILNMKRTIFFLTHEIYIPSTHARIISTHWKLILTHEFTHEMMLRGAIKKIAVDKYLPQFL